MKSLPKVGECIKYVESLGYKFVSYSYGSYWFEITDKSKRPAHNHSMIWGLGDMRHAVKHGC